MFPFQKSLLQLKAQGRGKKERDWVNNAPWLIAVVWPVWNSFKYPWPFKEPQVRCQQKRTRQTLTPPSFYQMSVGVNKLTKQHGSNLLSNSSNIPLWVGPESLRHTATKALCWLYFRWQIPINHTQILRIVPQLTQMFSWSSTRVINKSLSPPIDLITQLLWEDMEALTQLLHASHSLLSSYGTSLSARTPHAILKVFRIILLSGGGTPVNVRSCSVCLFCWATRICPQLQHY